MKWAKTFLTILGISLLPVKSYAVLGDNCTWPSSPDTYTERSTGYVVQASDWNKVQCALNNLQSQLGTNLQLVLKLSANNTISGNSTFTGDVTFSDFASCILSVDSNGKLGCSVSSLNCNTIMGCEAKDTDAQFLSVTGGPCNPSTGSCVFELAANWADINMTGIMSNHCRIAISNQGRLETQCSGQNIKRYAWTGENGSGSGSGCPTGQALVGNACLPVSEVLISGISQSKANLITSSWIVPIFDSVTKELELSLNQGAVSPIHLDSPDNTTAALGECVKIGDNALGQFKIQDCFTPETSRIECVTLLASAITCKGTGGCTDPADIDGTNFSYRGANFSNSSDQTGNFVFKLPENLTESIASVKFAWISNNAACSNGADDDVCWEIDGDSFANDALFNSGSLGATSVGVADRCTANGDIMVTDPVIFTHSMVAGETAVIAITRDTDESTTECDSANDAIDDDYAQPATLLWAEFCYAVDKVFSGE